MSHNRSKQNNKHTYNGITAKSRAQKAELLNLYFYSVLTRPNVSINEKKDGYEEFPSVTDIAGLQVSVQKLNSTSTLNLDVTKACLPGWNTSTHSQRIQS